ncbi:response regulator transcription factor [Actimicrobium sp. CCC2.4]|uniref:response regulator transcription factor n=1 Tax=Actimicrobium sp. CCC2.4 TaxID=3048606 RepID=UPI002AC8EEDD|nr:response regulator transcription factor [Actimicrobium sp. CCC2.4]MEB0135964.1 response regulator transcription factor [Actimicrobium sp. CCC2.4]WPX32627.1 response regulator transcription factor [Actimicrobium sp. CCC2.4]
MPPDIIRVMLVDDHAVVRSGVRLMLGTTADIIVTGEADSGQAAMKLVAAQVFDVALVDIALPGRNGLELLKQLRQEQPGLAVLMFSMYSEEVYAVRALRQGAVGYLTKDSSAAVIIDAVRTAAAGRKYVSPALVERLAELLGEGVRFPHEALSDRELEVMKLLASGDSLVQIAAALHLSASTVTTYRSRILEKTGLKGNTALSRYAIEHGLIA